MNVDALTQHHRTMPDLAVSVRESPDALSVRQHGHPAARRPYVRKMAGLLEDAMVLVLAVLLLPVVIYLVGTPIALCVQAIIAIVRLVV